MRGRLRFALLALGASTATGSAAELTVCPSTKVQAEIREAAGSSIDALTSAVTDVERRYGAPHSRRRVSQDEVRLIYRSGQGAVSVSLARDAMGRIATDCVAY